MSTEPRRVVVTGLGATTPVGGDVASTWEALLAGRSGVRTLEDDWYADLPVRFAGQRRRRSRARSSSAPRPASSTARSRSRSSPPARPGRDAGCPEVDPLRLGVVIASGIGGVVTLLDEYDILKTRGLDARLAADGPDAHAERPRRLGRPRPRRPGRRPHARLRLRLRRRGDRLRRST